ncbi:hypothetical protein ACPA9J_27970 [Pseudomonas aeruginosa]
MSSSAFRPTRRGPGANARTTSTTAASTPRSALPRASGDAMAGAIAATVRGDHPASRHWKQSARRNCSSTPAAPKPHREARWKTTRGNSERLAASEQAYLDTSTASCRPDNQRREQSQALLAELERARAEFQADKGRFRTN